ncbi:unnamed protein product [Lymnaea stagnalis]|uniref:Uncharacterized protein n=1 Tax=Lymnaea stagnalis TaxID=6523 RepID=A0AAV2I3L4_LYMST
MADIYSNLRWLTTLVIAALVVPLVWSDSTQSVRGIGNSTQTLSPSAGSPQSDPTQADSNGTASSLISSIVTLTGGLRGNGSDAETVNTTLPPKAGRLLPIDPVLNVSIHEQPWYNHTILFDETLIESKKKRVKQKWCKTQRGDEEMTSRILNFLSFWNRRNFSNLIDILRRWVDCLTNDQASRCITTTEYIFGTPYAHQANITSQTKTENNTGEIFLCKLEDPRYLQDNGVIVCSRGLTPCNDTLTVTACTVSTPRDSAQLYWDVNQDVTVEYRSQFVNVSCGNECFQDPPTSPPSATTEAKVVEASGKDNTYIWIIVGVVLGALLIAVVVILVVVFYRRRRKNKKGSKTLEDGGSKPSEVRSSVLFHREEDPSDELRVPENDDISGIAYANIKLSEASKRQSAVSASSSSRAGNEYSNIAANGTSNRVSSGNANVKVKSDPGASGSQNEIEVKTGDVKHSSSANDIKKEKTSGSDRGSDSVDTNKKSSYATLGKSEQRERNTYDSLQKSSEDDDLTEITPAYSLPDLSDHSKENVQAEKRGDALYANGQKGNKPAQHVRNYSDQDETDGAYNNLKRPMRQQASGRDPALGEASSSDVYSLAQSVPVVEPSSQENTYFELENHYANSSGRSRDYEDDEISDQTD